MLVLRGQVVNALPFTLSCKNCGLNKMYETAHARLVCSSVELELRKMKSYSNSAWVYFSSRLLMLQSVHTFCSLYVPWQWKSGFARQIVQFYQTAFLPLTRTIKYTHNILRFALIFTALQLQFHCLCLRMMSDKGTLGNSIHSMHPACIYQQI